ncbi:MAG: hypothetical protein Q8Q44_05145, partial [Nocardioides sp.]|nr:hypothetical protein [Nocardioides sp.]
MTRFADPHTCPDCGAGIDPASTACRSCALPLRGPVAQQLYATLLTADELLERLRSTARVAVPTATPVGVDHTPAAVPPTAPPASGPAVGPAVGPAGDPVAGPAAYPASSSQQTPQQPPRRGLAAPTVPKILLALGALCLLVAALVFLAVAWAVLGVGGRTVVLVGMTAAAGGASYLLTHKDLRSGAESLAVVAFGLLALDVAGAENAGWLGDPGPGVLLVVMGCALAALAHTAAEVARTTPVARLATAEITTAMGAVLVVTGALIRLDHPEFVLTVAVLALAGAAALAHRRRFTILTPLLGASAGVWWLTLTTLGLTRAIEHHTIGELWGRLDAWPTLVAALFAVA